MCPQAVGLGPLSRKGGNQGRGFLTWALAGEGVGVYAYKRSAVKVNVNVRFVANEPGRSFFQEKGMLRRMSRPALQQH
jgi:hypothetical protein